MGGLFIKPSFLLSKNMGKCPAPAAGRPAVGCAAGRELAKKTRRGKTGLYRAVKPWDLREDRIRAVLEQFNVLD